VSNLADKIEKHIKDSFGSYKYVKEKYVKYQNNRLFFDFFLPELGILIEVQG